MPFGGLKGFGTKNNGMDMTLGNEIILTRGELHRKKIENEYNNKNDGSDLSLMFFVFGVIFFGISLVSVWVL